MFGLAGEQLKIVNRVIRWIAVNVMDYLAWVKETTKILFHYVTMFENVFSARRLDIRGVRMIIWSNNHHVTIFSFFASARPSWSFVFDFAKHRIIRSGFTTPIHRVIHPSNVTMVSWIGVGEIARCYATTNRAVLTLRRAFVLPELFTALSAGNKSTCLFSFACTLHRAIYRLYRRVCLIVFPALVACSSDHRLNYTTGW